jgi:amidase
MPSTNNVHGSLPADLGTAFDRYEAALAEDDLDTLAELFAPDDLFGADSPTLRGDDVRLLVGSQAIAGFRASRGGSPARTLLEVHARLLSPDAALLLAEVAYHRGGRGRQTQIWQRSAAGWRITAAHVSATPPPLDRSVWRILGAPLAAPTGSGDLDGLGVAVKDLFAVAGETTGAGNPRYLADASVHEDDSAAVRSLRAAGAHVVGLSQTDEFAYSLAGTNPHSGTPRNPLAPGRIPGGSSSGSASAVALGHADVGLGTDTGGSVRVPAAYQGLFGIRTTLDAVDRTGLLPLARSFDTVGWFARDPKTLRAVGRALLPEGSSDRTFARALVAPSLLEIAQPDVADAMRSLVAAWGGNEHLPPITEADFNTDVLPTWQEAFRVIQGAEAWAEHGPWVERHGATLGQDVAGRFAFAATVTPTQLADARAIHADARARVRDFVGDSVLVIPAASSVAPLLDESGRGGSQIEAVRTATLRLTGLAGLAGLPAVSVPLPRPDGLPRGACLIGPAGSDDRLMALAEVMQATGLLA